MGLTHNSRPSDSKCPSDELHLSLSMRVLGTRYGHSNHHRRPSARTVADTPGRPFAAPNGRGRGRGRGRGGRGRGRGGRGRGRGRGGGK